MNLRGITDRSRLSWDYFWLAIALSVGGVVYIAYLNTHTHPAYEGGLYLQIAEEIIQSNYGFPKHIPYYHEGGIPFAYPPLMFYVIAFITDFTGIDPVSLELYIPGLVTIAYLIPYYFISKDLLGTSRKAGIASIFFAVTPLVLRWHISAGGIVRGVAMLFTLIGIYAGLKIFRTGSRWWLLPGTVLFTLTMLTHPVYTVFYGGTYLLLFAYYDQTPRGFVNGAIVAIGGVVLTVPWWFQIATTHGLDIYLTASGTHTGLTGGADRILSQFIYPLWDMNMVTPFYAAAFAGGIYATLRRRYFLPVWLVLASYVIGKDRFTFVAGSMLSAILVVEVIIPAVSTIDINLEFDPSTNRRKVIPAVLAFIFVLGAIGTGVAFAGSELNTAHTGSSTQPQTVDNRDLQAMEWIKSNTSSEADFVVLSDAAEWVPYYTERTVIVSPWGAEWTSTAGYYEEYELYRNLGTCSNIDCLEVLLGVSQRQPDYLYISNEVYTVHGDERTPRMEMIHSMTVSDQYELQYKNRGVVIFKLTDQPKDIQNAQSTQATQSAQNSQKQEREQEQNTTANETETSASVDFSGHA